jgi:hypothetical protein
MVIMIFDHWALTGLSLTHAILPGQTDEHLAAQHQVPPVRSL